MSLICRLTLHEFHVRCSRHLGKTTTLPLEKIQLGAVFSLQGESIQEIAHIPNLDIRDDGWDELDSRPDVMENGWSR